jgi:hypothetical protein
MSWILYPELLWLLKLKDDVSGGFIVNRLAPIRQRTHAGRSLGKPALIQSLEKTRELEYPQMRFCPD